MLLGRRPLTLVVEASFLWCSIAKRRVEPSVIVAELDVTCDVFASMFTRWVHGPIDSFDLQGGVERLRLGIVETRTYPAN